MTAPVLRLEGVTFRHDGNEVLASIGLEVQAGEVVALLGPSGSGKSTIIRLLLGFATPAAGTVWIDGERASADGAVLAPPEERRLAVVFQDLALWPHLTVAGNLDFALGSRRLTREQRDGRVQELLERVGLAGKEHRRPDELSGGERQRVAIARALVQEPRAILLDEPLGSLDVRLRHEIVSLLGALFDERGSTVLFVTHDLREARELADRVIVLESGRIAQQGAITDLCERPATDFVRQLVSAL